MSKHKSKGIMLHRLTEPMPEKIIRRRFPVLGENLDAKYNGGKHPDVVFYGNCGWAVVVEYPQFSGTYYVPYLEVAANLRRRGYGTEFLQRIIKEVAWQGGKEIIAVPVTDGGLGLDRHMKWTELSKEPWEPYPSFVYRIC